MIYKKVNADGHNFCFRLLDNKSIDWRVTSQPGVTDHRQGLTNCMRDVHDAPRLQKLVEVNRNQRYGKKWSVTDLVINFLGLDIVGSSCIEQLLAHTTQADKSSNVLPSKFRGSDTIVPYLLNLRLNQSRENSLLVAWSVTITTFKWIDRSRRTRNDVSIWLPVLLWVETGTILLTFYACIQLYMYSDIKLTDDPARHASTPFGHARSQDSSRS